MQWKFKDMHVYTVSLVILLGNYMNNKYEDIFFIEKFANYKPTPSPFSEKLWNPLTPPYHRARKDITFLLTYILQFEVPKCCIW